MQIVRNGRRREKSRTGKVGSFDSDVMYLHRCSYCRAISAQASLLLLLLDCVTGTALSAEPLDLRLKSITSISVDIRAKEEKLPEDIAKQVFAETDTPSRSLADVRDWYESEYLWTAPAIAYKPLYFEHASLERYGHHYGVLQPAVSAAHFFGRLPAIPYLRGAQPGHRRYYSLGHYRPGASLPHFGQLPAVNLRGALYQGAATTGLFFLAP